MYLTFPTTQPHEIQRYQKSTELPFARPLFSAWFTKSWKRTQKTCDSNVWLSWLYKKHPQLTLLACMRIPTCVPFMQNVSPSCPMIRSWHAASKVKGYKRYVEIYLFKHECLKLYMLWSTCYIGITVYISFQSSKKCSLVMFKWCGTSAVEKLKKYIRNESLLVS